MTGSAAWFRRHQRGLGWAASLTVSVALIYWLLSGFSASRFVQVLARSDPLPIAGLFAALFAEQLLRAWKWRLVLGVAHGTRTVDHLTATLAGHLFGLTVGIGSSVFARAWIVAQKFRLRTALVVGSVAMDRLIDLAVFAAIAVAAVSLLPLPAGLGAPGRLAIVLTAATIAAGLAVLAGVLWAWRRRGFADAARPRFPTRWIPARFTAWWSHHSEAFVAGLDWPRERLRRILILLLAILIKALAVSDVLWAGWAVGVWLPAGDYLLIMVALGCLILFGFFFRVPGSNLLAAVLILTLFGIGREQAAAIMLLMQTGFLALCALVGGPSLLRVGWPRRGRVSAPASPAAEVAQGGDGSTNPLS